MLLHERKFFAIIFTTFEIEWQGIIFMLRYIMLFVKDCYYENFNKQPNT